jgi:hypothetical protein
MLSQPGIKAMHPDRMEACYAGGPCYTSARHERYQFGFCDHPNAVGAFAARSVEF